MCFARAIAHLASLYEQTIREKDEQQSEVGKQNKGKRTTKTAGGVK